MGVKKVRDKMPVHKDLWICHLLRIKDSYKNNRSWKSKDSSVQFSHSVVSDSLRPHGLQHARLPYSSPTPRTYSNSHPSLQWCHPTTSSSVIPFSSCPQSFPASGSFPMNQLFTSGGQSIGASAINSKRVKN